jgi:hypothetical protein
MGPTSPFVGFVLDPLMMVLDPASSTPGKE